MKAPFPSLAMALLTMASHSALAGSQAENIDYNHGYCVPNGLSLKKENAIVVVAHQKMNGVFIPLRKDHMFFAPYSIESRHVLDWGGDMNLVKTGEVHGHVIAAFYENHTHSNNVEKQPVLCVADGIFLE